MPNKTKILTIQTPEGIAFPMEIASPIARFMAWFIDKAAVMAFVNIASVLANLAKLISPDIAGAFMMALYFGVSLFYPILFEWYWRGQTLGKRVLKLRVVDVEGLRMDFSQIVVRNLLRAVDVLPQLYMVGGLTAYLNKRGQRLGDIAANTIVIQHVEIEEPDLDQGLSDKYNSFKEYPHIAARLRQNISPSEAGIAVQALVRRDSLEDEARLNLFAGIRAHFHKAAKFPPEVTDGISDEQYIRNAVEILFD